MDTLSYADLWDGFESVSVRMSQDFKVLKDLQTYYKKRQEIEDNYSKSLRKLSQSTLETPKWGTIVHCVASAKQEAEGTAEVHSEIAKRINQEINGELTTFFQSSKKNWDKLKSEGQKLTKQLANDKIIESRAKDKFQKLSQDAKMNDKLAKKARQAENSYSKSVIALRDTQTKHYDQMPQVLSQLQALHLDILGALQRSLRQFETVQRPVVDALERDLNASSAEAQKFSPLDDVASFAVELQAKSAPRPPIASFESADGAQRGSYDPGSVRGSYDPPSARGSYDPVAAQASQPSYSNNGAPAERQPPSVSSPLQNSSSPPNVNSPPTNSEGFRSSRISMLFSKPPTLPDNYSEETVDVSANYENYDENYDSSFVGEVSWRCEALYDWQGDEAEGELSLASGETLQVTFQHGGGWLCGTNSQGQIGNFPENYVTFI